MKRINSFMVLAAVLLMTVPAMAQKFAWVHSQRVLAEFQEYVDAQNKLNTIRNEYDSEYQNMLKEKKQEKQRQAQENAMAIEKYKYEKLGPEGEYYKKTMEITKPIIDKINALIAQIGENEGYDFIFDAASGALLHAVPKYDITDRIIEELNKGAAPAAGKK